jgi:hypothetical protein
MGNLNNIFCQLPNGIEPFDLRILPPKQGCKLFHGCRTHRLANGTHFCHMTLKDGKWIGQCDYCSLFTALWRQQREQEAKQIKPVERIYYNVIDRRNQDKGPLVFSMGKTLHTIIITAIAGQVNFLRQSGHIQKPLGDVTHYKTGRDFQVRRFMQHGPGGIQYPDYSQSGFLEPSKAGTKKEWDFWMASLHTLSTIPRMEDAATVKSVIEQHMGFDLDQPKVKKGRVYRSIDAEWEV